MSKLTEVLKLLCYDPETDGNLTFNVTEALTKNWEKIDRLVLLAIAVAAAYDPEGSYAVGDYCTHGGKLHKCNTAIPTGETWTEAHWTTTTVAAEMQELSSQLSKKAEWMPNNWKTEADAPSAYPLNSATTFFSGNSFAGIDQCIVTTYAYNLNAARQIVSFLDNTGVKYRLAIGEDQWGAWKQISTATPPQEHAIVPKNGATLIDGMKNVFSKDQFGKIAINVGMNFESVPAKGTEIFSLPQSFAPAGGIDAGATVLSMGTACYPAFLTVNTDGAVVLQHNVTDYSGQIDLFGFMCFGTGGTK